MRHHAPPSQVLRSRMQHGREAANLSFFSPIFGWGRTGSLVVVFVIKDCFVMTNCFLTVGKLGLALVI